ncbi:protein WHAT'S THIS FACTOR 9, mitochondrial-like [Aristolochia californica]|uniref:protein WHAT'S THIS FACTOR 9, mitochondrial-like n=1 Tax=Aristolochia californica TaxID=171875 RepID=UPI0035D7CFBC
MMQYVFRCLHCHQRQSYLYLQNATFVEVKVKWVRDRGLDHAVEKEKNLRCLIALKNFIFSEPSKSLPVSVVAEHKPQLALPTRAIDFIRKYPTIFVEYPSPTDYRRPHVRLTPEALALHQDEQSIYENCRFETADRLLKLLMLTPHKKLPLSVVDSLKWDLGLPDDYLLSLLPEFPDYFDVCPLQRQGSPEELVLDLVWWNKDLAVSAMERSAISTITDYKRGMPLAFPLQYSRGFEMDKKVKKWVDEWQKLPYITPYEDGTHLNPKSDLGEKWSVGLLHELFHLFVAKKAERETMFFLGEHWGLRSGFKRAFTHHPGIFYVSNKIRTHTVVLREAYKRDLLVKKHPLMGLRYHYIHLMNKGRNTAKTATRASAPNSKRTRVDALEGIEDNHMGSEEDDDEEGYSSGSFDGSSEEEDEEEEMGARQSTRVSRGPREEMRRHDDLRRQRVRVSKAAPIGNANRGGGNRMQSFGKTQSRNSKVLTG